MSRVSREISRRRASGRNFRVRMLWRRSASLTTTTRTSETIARIIFRKVSACSSSREAQEGLVGPRVVRLDSFEDFLETDHEKTSLQSTVNREAPLSTVDC